MTQPDLFRDTPNAEAGSNPGPAEEPQSPAMDWQQQPERLCPVTGKPRPQFVWPINYHTSGRKWHKKDGSTALKRAEAKRQAQEAAKAAPAFEGSHQLADRLDKEARGDETTEQKEQD